MKRSLLVITIVATMLGAFAPSHADCGAGGSPVNPAGSCESSGNQVRCAGTETPAGWVSASTDGVEYCRQGGSETPVQGRAGLSADCRCVYVDGDADNSGVMRGWIKVDPDGVHCYGAPLGGPPPPPNEPSYNSSAGRSCI